MKLIFTTRTQICCTSLFTDIGGFGQINSCAFIQLRRNTLFKQTLCALCSDNTADVTANIYTSDGDLGEINGIQARHEVLVGLHEQDAPSTARAQHPC